MTMMTMMVQIIVMMSGFEPDSNGISNGNEEEDFEMRSYNLINLFVAAVGQETKEMIPFSYVYSVLIKVWFASRGKTST